MVRQMLKRYLTETTPLSATEIDYIVSHFSPVDVKKNELLIRNDQICKQLFFIGNGALRVYCLKKDGQEWTRFIAFANEFSTIIPSFINQTPSRAFLQALEPSDLLSISHTDFFRLINELPEWDRFYRSILEKAYVASVNRIEQFISLDAGQLYQNYLHDQPQLIQRLSNKVLASYMGISPETLSRLKSKR